MDFEKTFDNPEINASLWSLSLQRRSFKILKDKIHTTQQKLSVSTLRSTFDWRETIFFMLLSARFRDAAVESEPKKRIYVDGECLAHFRFANALFRRDTIIVQKKGRELVKEEKKIGLENNRSKRS